MKYTYKKNGKSIEVWYDRNSILDAPYGEVSKVSAANDIYIPVQLNSETGDLQFTWTDGNTYKLNEFVCMTPEELVEAVNNSEDRVLSEYLCQTLMRYGVDSIDFMIPSKRVERYDFNGMVISMLSDDHKDEDIVAYRVREEFNRELSANYKLKLVPISDEDKMTYRERDFYVRDLMGLLQYVDGYSLRLGKTE